MSIKLAPYKDQTITTELNKLKSLDIVIWDDIGGTTANQNELDLLFSIISYRIANGLTNIFTGHLDYEDLAQKVGNRLADSIYNNSIVVQFKGVDRRAQQ
jgi:DNA replication protein DnaC